MTILAKRIVLGFCILITTVLLYLIVTLFSPLVSAPKQPIPKRKKENDERTKPPASRQDIQFAVAETHISAWLYLPPDTSQPVPCIVMSHGFGGTKDSILEKYALRFIATGTAVLTYDYRHIGASEGQPRQLYDTLSQLEDLRAAITYARARPETDAQKIVLWGTSASGGYGLIIAAEDERIAAVIGQCAGLDHEADSKLFHVKAAQALGDKAIVKSYPISHFDIYRGPYFEQALNENIVFLQSIR